MVREPARGRPLVVLQAVRVEDRDLDAVDGPVDRAAGQVQVSGDVVHRAPAGAGGEDSLRVLVDVGDMPRPEDGFKLFGGYPLDRHPP